MSFSLSEFDHIAAKHGYTVLCAPSFLGRIDQNGKSCVETNSLNEELYTLELFLYRDSGGRSAGDGVFESSFIGHWNRAKLLDFYKRNSIKALTQKSEIVNEPSIAERKGKYCSHKRHFTRNTTCLHATPCNCRLREHTSDFKWQSQSKDALQPICAKTVILKYALIW